MSKHKKDKKKSKSKHGKNKKHSKDHKKKSKTAHGHKKHLRSHPRKPPPLPPAQEDNLGGVVLVKDRRKKDPKRSRSPAAQPAPIFPAARTPPDVKEMMKAYRSVEPLNNATAPVDMAKGDAKGLGVSAEAEKKSAELLLPKGDDAINEVLKMKSAEEIGIATTPPLANPAAAPKPPKEKSPPKKTKDTTAVKSDPPPNEDLTKREEVSSNDKQMSKEEKQKKWRVYAEKLLDGGMDYINKDFRQVRGYIPSASTRVAFGDNPTENRFEDIVCIDHTRVTLKDYEKYIHASWVNVTKQHKVILTQLPFPHTSSTFWQMVIETGAQAILLLVTNYEMATFKGQATFPEQQDFLHFEDRHIRVGEFRRIKVASHWTMHVLSISNGDKRRYLHVHHYSGWNHGQELKNHMDILKIHSVFKRYKDPHVVVSLSGCGRAGTYASFCVAHERLHSDQTERVSVVDAVQKVRNGRMHAVQRVGQLKTIHMALGEHVLNNGFLQQMSDKQKDMWKELNGEGKSAEN